MMGSPTISSERPIVFIDTSFLRGTSHKDSRFLGVLDYSKQQKVILCISYISLEEWRTQKIEELSREIQSARSGINNVWRTNIIAEKFLPPAIDRMLPTMDEVRLASEKRFSELINEHRIDVIGIDNHHAGLTWEAYFHGHPPFSQVKKRSDIPDAWVYQAAKDVLEKYKAEKSFFLLCREGNQEDEELCKALIEIGFKAITLIELLSYLQAGDQVSPQEQPLAPASGPGDKATIERTTTIDEFDTLVASYVERDKELNMLILGYIYWFSRPTPISKEVLNKYIQNSGHSVDAIENMARRLPIILSNMALAEKNIFAVIIFSFHLCRAPLPTVTARVRF